MSDNNLKPELEGLVESMFHHIIDGTVIEGGHYLLEQEEDGKVIHLLNPESTATFEAAVQLYSKAKKQGKEVALSFLVGDLSVSPQARQEFNRDFRLPPEYIDILNKYDVSHNEIIFFYESRLRNRGDNRLKTGLKRGAVIESCSSLRLNPEIFGVADQVSNIAHENKPVPNCRMLLAQELQDKELLGFKKAINFCNEDVYNCRGRYSIVYHTLLDGRMDIINIYFNNDGTKNVLVYTKRRKDEK
jgi:hypothetical protein